MAPAALSASESVHDPSTGGLCDVAAPVFLQKRRKENHTIPGACLYCAAARWLPLFLRLLDGY
jgi:hypothetical protein